ncbi:MAG TPA: LacI family DNA-binding transcriptional regulator [Steroidobacteraceae bacterium]|nr:LacI family DNA-binding transcriptional regulator [Steroidobacteraceae bacterium]
MASPARTRTPQTLEGIARQARVSTATVSRYFNSPTVVAAATAARIARSSSAPGIPRTFWPGASPPTAAD